MLELKAAIRAGRECTVRLFCACAACWAVACLLWLRCSALAVHESMAARLLRSLPQTRRDERLAVCLTVQVRLLNYTKTGKPFWNMLTVAPIK